MSSNIFWEKGETIHDIKIPQYNDGCTNLVCNGNNGAGILCINNTSAEEYKEYCKKLSQEEFTLYSHNITDGYDCSAFIKNKDMAYVYFCPKKKIMRIVTEPDVNLIEEQALLNGTCEIHQLSLDQSEIDCGMSYVIKLCDGSFFIIDGGYLTKGECERLYEYIEKLSNEKIVISGWFFSHAHDDHIGCFTDFVKKYNEKVKIEKLYYNFQCMEGQHTNHWSEEDIREAEKFYITVNTYLGDIPQIKLHTGQRFTVKNLEFETLYTHEDLYPENIRSFNDCSTVLMMRANGKRVLWLGDIGDEASDILLDVYGEHLKCDVVQVAHHGFNGAKRFVYEFANPEVAFWPTADYRFDENIPRPANTFLLKESNVKKHIIAGYGTDKIIL